MHPTDIYIRNKTVWLAQSYLLKVCDGLTAEYMTKVRSQYKASVPASYHNRDVMWDSGKSWRWAYINDTFYYAYDNIPDKAPAKYKSQLPTHQELLNKTAIAIPAAQSFEAHFKEYLNNHYSGYLRSYNDCTRTQQENLSKAAAILEAAISYITIHNINIKKYAFFEQLSAFVKKYDIKYFPENPRVIKRKIETLKALITPDANLQFQVAPAITDVIRLPRADNDNASKGFYEDEIRSWVLQLRDMGQNFTNTYIIRKIQDMCTLTTKPAPKDRWIGGIMEDHNTKYLTAENRYGKKGRFAAIHRGYQPFQNALFAGDCWQVDGSRINLVSHKKEVTYIDKDGKEKTKKADVFLYVIAIRDVHSGDIIGWHYDLKEDRWAVLNAIKMAAKEMGYLPYEMIFDKFPGHNTPEMMAFLDDLRQWGVTITISSDPNVKPGMERWFGTLQTAFMQESKYYYGQGIKSRRNYAHRSEEYIKRMRQAANAEGFDWDAACTEATNIIENYRTTAYCKWSRKHSTVQQSPVQLREISETPHVCQLQPEEYQYLFGLKVKLPIDGGGLIKKEIQKITFYYRLENTQYHILSKHSHVLVCYDMDDLSNVALYSITEGPIKQFLGRAYDEIPAQRYGPGADWSLIDKRAALIKEFTGYKEQELEYRKTGTDDILSLIAPMSVSKHVAEAAETKYLLPPDASFEDDDTEIVFNPRNQY